MNDIDLDEIGTIIDRACDEKNEEELKLIIDINEDYVEREEKSIIKARVFYLLANAWGGLHSIRYKIDENSIWNYEQEEINKQIIYLRKAKQEKDFSSLHKDYQLSILTNLASIFNHAGRTVYAMRLYNQALEINPNFPMALANRGICFKTYAQLDYDNGHKNIFIKLAYDDFKKAVPLLEKYSQIDFYYYEVLQGCEKNIQAIENYYPQEFLNSTFDLENFSLGKSKEEQQFRSWTLYNTLFLNPINDIGYKKTASLDPLNLPNLITDIQSDIPKYISYFNQIKQEFITYRHLLYEGTNYKTKKFYDKDTVIIDDLKLNLNDINTEKIKLAFRGFYSIFDKIAYFLYEYFELDLKDNRIYFHTIWKMRNNKKFNTKFNDFENLALRGLYFISKDLFFNDENEDEKLFIEVIEPEAKKINDIRNYLEHKFINIKMFDMKKDYENEDKKIKNISLSELEEKTIHLAKLVREAIIYLSFSINIEESKKDKSDLFPIILNVK